MKTLIIPDVHHAVDKVESILSAEKTYDQTIYLGDYFDDFYDLILDVKKTANWLKTKLADPKNIMLIGNHDISYMFPMNTYLYCSGWTQEKSVALNEILKPKDLKRLKLFHYGNGILFSHAGVSALFYGQTIKSKTPDDIIKNHLIQDAEAAMKCAASFNKNTLLGAGYDRGGNSPIGGITWGDHSSHIPIPGLPQIYGHTPQQGDASYRVTVKNKTQSMSCSSKQRIPTDSDCWSLCLDTQLRQYGVIEGSVISIKTLVGGIPVVIHESKI